MNKSQNIHKMIKIMQIWPEKKNNRQKLENSDNTVVLSFMSV